jgi:hypothetical protein
MRCLSHLVDAALKRFFYRLGHVVGDHPGYFLVVPLLLTALCASGFQRLDYEFDPEYLFSPATGPAKAERAVLEQHFPANYSAFKVRSQMDVLPYKTPYFWTSDFKNTTCKKQASGLNDPLNLVTPNSLKKGALCLQKIRLSVNQAIK